jgi:hypothetical protein
LKEIKYLKIIQDYDIKIINYIKGVFMIEKFIEFIIENKWIIILLISISISFTFIGKIRKSKKIIQKNNIVNGDMAGRDIRKKNER